MKLNLNPKQIDRIRKGNLHSTFCFDDCIATYAAFIGKNYELMYSDAWAFNFVLRQAQDSESIGRRIIINRLNKYELLRKYHGIEIWNKQLTHDNGVDFIKNELLEERPVVLLLDCFWCPWDMGFQKYHNEGHSILVIGFNEIDNSFIGIDGYYNQSDLCLPMENFRNGFKSIKSFKLIDELAIEDPVSLVQNCASNMLQDQNGVNHFELMRNFSNELIDINIQEELEGNEYFWNTPLWYAFDEIIFSRIEYAVALKYMANKFNKDCLFKTIDMFGQVVEKWNVGKGMLTKIFNLNKSSYEVQKRLSSKIAQLADDEEQLAYDITKVNNTVGISNITRIANRDMDINSKNSNGDFIFIDLSVYTNNKSVDTNPPRCIMTDFTGHGHYFLFDEQLSKDIWNVEDILFNVYIKQNESYDNVSCAGQSIPVPEDYYEKIYILGCAEYGDYSDEIIIQTSEEYSYNLPIMFYEWSNTLNDDIIAWEGKIVEKKGNEITIIDRSHRIYAKEYLLNRDKKINRIRLPDCPNIHIFAVTMYKL